MAYFLRFKDATDFKYIANYFGIAENFVGKILGKWEDALMYATHKNAPEKYQYPDTAVTSNFSYMNVIEEYIEKSANRYTLDSIIEMIDREEITQYNYTEKIPFNVRVKFQRSIDKAFQEKIKEKSKNYKRNINVVYMSGASGVGKTSFAQYFAEEQGYSFCVSGSSNDPLESYNGEKCLILDELRPDDWSFSDLLKLLDNNTGSMIKSRFHNKFFCGRPYHHNISL